jgi:hypothetical protein
MIPKLLRILEYDPKVFSPLGSLIPHFWPHAVKSHLDQGGGVYHVVQRH